MVVTVKALPTTGPIRHLVKHHSFTKQGGEVAKKRKRDNEGDLPSTVKRQIKAQTAVFQRDDWQAVFLAWAVADDVSLKKTTSKRLRRLLLYRCPILKDVIPKAPSTSRIWKLTAFEQLKPTIVRHLALAKSRISLSFDAWKSDNELDLLGVVAHYVDSDYNVKNVLLALRNTYGSHTAEELKHHLLAVIREYRITTKIAFFMADSAQSNDAALRLLQEDLPIEPSKQRLRCACHIINLVCKAILYGVDTDCMDDALEHDETNSQGNVLSRVSYFENVLRTNDELAKLKAWRKKGPIGKLHNIVVHARATPSRREFFKSKQREAQPDAERLYQLIVNGGIRWNSTCDMLERAFKLKDAIELYYQAYRVDTNEPTVDDHLSGDDWLELRHLLDLLQPLKQMSLCLQSDGKECHHGSLWESLTGIDYLMTKLERLKSQHAHLPNSHFKASINLGWKKLDKYYTLSDDTPAYRAAIVVHPSKKMKWFEQKWQVSHPEWLLQVKDAIATFYNTYKQRHADEAIIERLPAKEMTEFELYNLPEDDTTPSDDLERYFREERASPGTNPLTWWQFNCHRYPILSHMAFDLLGAPASSSADERTFSKGGNVFNDERFNTLDDLAEGHQCLKSWSDEGLIWQETDSDGSDDEGDAPPAFSLPPTPLPQLLASPTRI